MQATARGMLLSNLAKYIEKNLDGSHRLIIPTSKEDGETYQISSRLVKELASFRQTKTRAGSPTFQSDIDHDDCVLSLTLGVRDMTTARSMGTAAIYSDKITRTSTRERRKSVLESEKGFLEPTSKEGVFKIITHFKS